MTSERKRQPLSVTEGQVTLTLADIDNNVYQNYRRSVDEKHIADLQLSLKGNRNGEQLQNLVCSYQTKTHAAGLVAGYCRLEAMLRNALHDVITEYNEEMGLDIKDDGFIKVGGNGFGSQEVREKLLEQGEAWVKKYWDALAAYPVNVNLDKPDMTPTEADLKNVTENRFRKDPPLWDDCIRVGELLDRDVPGKDIAEALGYSAGKISQMRSIGAFPARFTERIKDHEFSDEDRELVNTALLIFMERCQRDRNDPLAIGLSHGREFVGAAMHKKDPLSIQSTVTLLYLLTGIDLGRTTDNPPMEYGAFIARIRQEKVSTHFDSAPKVSVPKTDDVGVESPGIIDTAIEAPSMSDVLSVSDVANAQEAIDSDPLAEADLASANEEIGAAEPGQEEVGDDDESITNLVSAVDSAADSGSDAGAVDVDIDLDGQEMSSTDMMIAEDTLSDADETDEMLSDEVLGGKANMAAIDANTAMKTKSQSSIIASGDQYKLAASQGYDETNTILDAIAAAMAAVNCYEIAGHTDAANESSESFAVFIEEANAWFGEVLSLIKECDSEAFAYIQESMPAYCLPEED